MNKLRLILFLFLCSGSCTICFSAEPIPVEDWSFIGHFSSTNPSSESEGECGGFTISLWKIDSDIIGRLVEHEGDCNACYGVPIFDVEYDEGTGTLTFTATGKDAGLLTLFEGKLEESGLSGKIRTVSSTSRKEQYSSPWSTYKMKRVSL